MKVNTMLPTLLDCTLRDGSYAINFQFTADDTRNLCSALENIGINWIEVGHGVGLCASTKGYGDAAETDVSYMEAAASVLHKAHFGMFCIPGIATLEALKEAINYGMKFVRIGVNLEHYKQVAPYIELARKHDVFTCVNFMKSYSKSPVDFAQYTLEAERYGAHLVYLVDSAGGMLPEEIDDYVKAIREKSDTLRLGFHGHHNLGLGVANALKAIDKGIEYIDVSLMGLGRSAGNTPAEQLVCALIRRGIDINIDPVAMMDISERYIRPLLDGINLNSLDIISGLALFHSSYMNIIEKFARKYRVDPRHLIIAVSQLDKVNIKEDVVEEQATKLAEIGMRGNWKSLYRHYYGGEQV